MYARNYSGGARWIEATIIKSTGPMSYLVQAREGQLLRRHVDQLKKRFPVNAEQQRAQAEFSEEVETYESAPEYNRDPEQSSHQSVTTEGDSESPPPPAENGLPDQPDITHESPSPSSQPPLKRSTRVRTAPKYLEDFIHSLWRSYLRGEGCNVCSGNVLVN